MFFGLWIGRLKGDIDDAYPGLIELVRGMRFVVLLFVVFSDLDVLVAVTVHFQLSESLRPLEFQRILIHELFHFVWVRLGNPRRGAWQNLIETELNRLAPGELGWSAEWRKQAGKRSGRAWRDYLAESFCDTAAWFYTRQDHGEFTLAKRFRARRARWMTGLAVTSLPL